MLECRACVLRCIRAIAGNDVAAINRPLLLTPQLAIRTPRRRLATATAFRDDVPELEDALSAELSKQEDDEKRGSKLVRTKKKAPVIKDPKEERALKQELDWLKDPMKLAHHVHYTLRNNNPEKAVELCRMASKSMDCVVSWNHVVDWYMKQEKVNSAIETYNEMKKRGQFPDAYTYMQLFRGFPMSSDMNDGRKMQMAVKAVSIYNSMSSPTSRVRPSIMHTNAVLKLCSRARDMDSLWHVASQIPESGPGSADHWTYTILIGAVKHGAFGRDSEEGLPLETIARNRQQAVNEGRRIWQEVIQKWRGGEVMIDDSLIVEMAKLLLFSKRMEDWDDVLSLVQQTCNIERLVAPVGSPERNTGHVPQDDPPEEQHSNNEDSEGWVPTPAASAFKPVTPIPRDAAHPKRPKTLAWVQPTNGVLSVLLEACTEMRIPRIAHAYWDKLTAEHNVDPDLSNFHYMLRLLRINRSAKNVVRLLTDLKDAEVKRNGSTYRVATSACMRDWKNPNIIDLITQIIDDMEQTLPYPDVPTLENYLSLALQTEDKEKLPKALERMRPIIDKWSHLLTHGFETRRARQNPPLSPEEIEENALSFFRTMISTIDTVVTRELISEDKHAEWRKVRFELDTRVGELANKVDGEGGHLVRKHSAPGAGWTSGRNIRKGLRLKVRRDDSGRTRGGQKGVINKYSESKSGRDRGKVVEQEEEGGSEPRRRFNPGKRERAERREERDFRPSRERQALGTRPSQPGPGQRFQRLSGRPRPPPLSEQGVVRVKKWRVQDAQ